MVHTETRQKVMIITPTAEIDAHSAERIRTQVDAAFEKSPCTHMVFNFEKVDFMDSSGIGMLIGRYKQAEKRGGATALVNLGDPMVRLFSLSGLAKIIQRFPSVDEAVKAFSAGKGGTQ